MTHARTVPDVEALVRSEMRYRRLFQTAKDGILILDAHSGKIVDANDFMCDLLGRAPDELLGKELWEIGLFADIEQNKAAFRELQERDYVRYDHLPVVNRDGVTVEVEFISNVYREGDRLVAQCNVRDIAERSRLEKRVQDQAATLTEAHRFKDEFLAMLSHELRNPLAPILSATQLLQRGARNDVERHACEVIERQVASLSRLTRELLDVSRVVNGKLRLRLEVVDMRRVLENAVETVAPMMERRRHSMAVTLPPDPVRVDADATRLEEVVVNLLSNAAKYTNDGGKIELSLVAQEKQAVLVVRDSGVGIEPEFLPRIFDLFSQGQRSLDRAEGGLGVGLCLVQRLVELHGGTVEARSAGVGRGSEFTVRLPLAAALASPSSPAAADVASPHKGFRVLVVDDNQDACTMLAHLLERDGYDVQTASTSPAALRAVKAWLPNVVLLDIGLPDIDGYEVARRIRRDHAPDAMRLVAITGYGSELDVQTAKDAGFDEHMLKPVSFDDLARVLEPWSSGSRAGSAQARAASLSPAGK